MGIEGIGAIALSLRISSVCCFVLLHILLMTVLEFGYMQSYIFIKLSSLFREFRSASNSVLRTWPTTNTWPFDATRARNYICPTPSWKMTSRTFWTTSNGSSMKGRKNRSMTISEYSRIGRSSATHWRRNVSSRFDCLFSFVSVKKRLSVVHCWLGCHPRAYIHTYMHVSVSSSHLLVVHQSRFFKDQYLASW